MWDLVECLIDTALFFYFRIVTLVFWAYNSFFQVKKVVPPPAHPLTLKSATVLAKLVRERKVKSIDIIEAYIARIEEVNGIINAITYKLFDEARNKAKQIDGEIASMDDHHLWQFSNNRPLLGLPFTCKDSISVQGQVITVGMYNRRNTVVHEDADVIKRMRDAGAIHLAITTVPETCMWVEANTYLWGVTRNPYDSRRNVGGSSGGEGALQGAAASLMGIGSDIGGSVRIPSFMNGVFGFISSPGVVPVKKHIPEGGSGTYKDEMGRIGPLTRFAEDLPLLHNVLSGTKPVEVSMDNKVPLDKIRLFCAEGLTHYKRVESLSKETKESMLKAVQHFESKFDKVAQTVTFPETKKMYDIYFASYGEEGEPTAAQMMYDLENPSVSVNCVLELLKYPFGQSKHSLSAIIFALAIPFKTYSADQRRELIAAREKMKRRVVEFLGNDGILFMPSWPTLVQFHNETIAKQTSFIHTGLINVLGLPAIQCPMGLTNGLPNGVMIVGNKGSEQLLLDAAMEISNAFGGWVAPGI